MGPGRVRGQRVSAASDPPSKSPQALPPSVLANHPLVAYACGVNGWTLIFIFRDERVLLIRRDATRKVLPGLVNGVGGRVEADDADMGAAARREVREETGLTPGEMAPRGALVFDRRHTDGRADDRGVVYLYTCEDFSGQSRDRCDEGELFWCPWDQVEDQALTPELRAYWPKLIESPPRPIHVYSEFLDDRSKNLVVTT